MSDYCSLAFLYLLKLKQPTITILITIKATIPDRASAQLVVNTPPMLAVNDFTKKYSEQSIFSSPFFAAKSTATWLKSSKQQVFTLQSNQLISIADIAHTHTHTHTRVIYNTMHVHINKSIKAVPSFFFLNEQFGQEPLAACKFLINIMFFFSFLSLMNSTEAAKQKKSEMLPPCSIVAIIVFERH